MLPTIFASIAGVCMAICQIPQVVLIWRTGNTDGISIFMQIILTAGISSWFVTGILLHNAPMYLSNGFCALSCYYILYKCIVNRKHKQA